MAIITYLTIAGLTFLIGVTYGSFKGSGDPMKAETARNSNVIFKKIQLNTGLKLMAIPGNTIRYYLKYVDDLGNEYVFVNADGTYWPLQIKNSIRTFDKLSAFNLMPKDIALANLGYTQIHILFEDKDALISLTNRKLAGYAEISKATEIDLAPKFNENISTNMPDNIPTETEIITKMLEAESNGDKEAENEMLDLWENNYKQK